MRNPGVYGPKSLRASGSVENEMIVVVRPWKLSAATTIVACPCGTPLTRYPHARDTLMALSTASAPVFIGSVRSAPHSSASSRQNGPNWSCRNARLVSVSRSSWARAAPTRAGCRWPKFRAEYPARQARRRAVADGVDPDPRGAPLGGDDRIRKGRADPLPATRRERLGQVGDPGRAAEDGQRGVQVVEARVDQVERDDRAAEQLLRLGVRVQVGAEPGAGEQEALGQQQVALALVDALRLLGEEAVAGEPVQVRR